MYARAATIGHHYPLNTSLDNDGSGADPIYLCVFGLHRARALRLDEDNLAFEEDWNRFVR